MLGLKSLRIPQSEILDRMLSAWYTVKNKGLTWTPEGGNYPYKASPKFIHNLMMMTDTLDASEGKPLLAFFKKSKIRDMEMLRTEAGQRRSLSQLTCTDTGQITGDVETAISKMDALLPLDQLAQMHWFQAEGWRWSELKPTSKGTWDLFNDNQRDRLKLAEHTVSFWSKETRRWFHGATIRNRIPPLSSSNDTLQSPATTEGFDPKAGWSDTTMIQWDHAESEPTLDMSQRHDTGRNINTTRIRRQSTPDRTHTWSTQAFHTLQE
ncbi:hypothetical protein R1sor_021834 [Riccia sorocarpa]|uniref:Uncharacterized protein n=1 Tax=Riccia sorocarpa TaxID=122646 RepID=A0ABD3GIW6_9MARC